MKWASQRLQAGELSKPGPELDDFTRKLLLGLWLETLEELGPERFDAAFKQVLQSSPYRPDISEIRRAAGVNRGIVDPEEQAAMRALEGILAAMRRWGPQLRPLLGEILNDGRDAEGLVLTKPERGPSVPAPVLHPHTALAIERIGMGSQVAGLEAIACHPALPWNSPEDEQARSFRMKNAAEIERRWVECWRGTA